MQKKKNLKKLLIALLLIGLTVCLTSSCRSVQITDADVKAVLASIAPPMPIPPEIEPVWFEDYGNGLWLSYNDYRALERDIIAMREYIAKLENVIKFYREEK